MKSTNGIAYGTMDVRNLVGKIATGNATNSAGSRVAYLEDVTGATNGLLTTITNIAAGLVVTPTNTTQLPGVVTDGGRGIGTNLSNYPTLVIATNIANTSSQNATNGYATVVTNIANYLITANDPTNTAVVGQVIHATSTGGARKWDYVNQALTNSVAVQADFNKPYSKFTTNAAFLWLLPINVDTTLTKIQVTDVTVTNSTAAAKLMTFDASVYVTGVPYVTNETDVHWKKTPWRTNAVCEPVF